MRPGTLEEFERPGDRLPAEFAKGLEGRREPLALAFRAVVRRQRAASVVLRVLVIPILLTPLWGPALPSSVVLEVVLLLVIGMAFTGACLAANWRCPRCGRFLGPRGPLGVDPKVRHCPYCGCALR